MALAGIGTGATLALAAAFISVFFATNDERFDTLSGWFFVLFAAFAIAFAILVQQRLAAASDAAVFVTVLGIVGVAALGLLELLATLGRIDFRLYGWLGALGFAGWLAWIAGVSGVGLASGTLPAALCWLGLGSVALGLVIVARLATDRSVIRGERSPGLGEMSPLLVVFLAVVAWLVWLGISL